MTLDQADFWARFCARTGHAGPPDTVDAFGDSPDMADALAALIVSGRKRATAALARHYKPGGPPLPRPGDLGVVLNGRGAPVCVIRTVDVEIRPVSAVDAAFAWEEGEGDRSLQYWLDAHRAFFKREARREGFEYSDDLDVVCERFERVWP